MISEQFPHNFYEKNRMNSYPTCQIHANSYPQLSSGSHRVLYLCNINFGILYTMTENALSLKMRTEILSSKTLREHKTVMFPPLQAMHTISTGCISLCLILGCFPGNLK